MRTSIRQSRKRFLPVLATLAVLLLGGCATAPTSPTPPTAVGYTLVGDVVEFHFAAWDYHWVTNGKTGQWFPLEKFPRIDTVAVAGPFNQWQTNTALMTRQDDGSYTLRLAKSNFTTLGSKVPFKFVINDLWWVEPPVQARNSVDTQFVNKSSNLILELP